MQIGVSCPRGLISWEECLGSCAPNPLHPCDYTPDILDQMRTDYTDPDREPGVESFTPTRLLGCARQPVIMGQSDHYVDVDGAWNLVRGNMVHALMEQARYPSAVAVVREKRMSTTVMTKYGPQPFTAKPDLIVVKNISFVDQSATVHIKVVDYKTKADIKHDLTSVQMDHALQVNMYAWVASECLLDTLPLIREMYDPTFEFTVQVDEVEVVYCSMRKVRRFTSAGPRLTKGKRLTVNPLTYETLTLQPITLWDMDLVGKFIAAKIEERIEAEVELPDILTGDAAWRCDYCPVRQLCFQIGNQP